MSLTAVEKEICENCGADVRENTLFCYNCGSRVAETDPGPIAKPEEPADVGSSEAESALADLAKKIKIEPPSEDEVKRSKAAADRKKARGGPRKQRQVTWEPADEDGPNRILLLVSLLIAVMAGAVVFVMTFWK